MSLSAPVVVAAVERPAGGAALDEVLIATVIVVGLSAVLGAFVLAYRAGRLRRVDRALDGAARSGRLATLVPWAHVSLVLATVSLVTALFGMYWDIALHIGVGRDEGPLANPAHYPILFGLFGVSAAGVLACAMPRSGQAGPAAVRLSRTWDAPAGGLLLVAAGSYALLGFPLDDVWHRIFGQDVTLWGPTHLMLIGGAGLSLVAMAVLFEEGRAGGRSADRDGDRLARGELLLRASLAGGMLIGMSVFQAEFDFGVPQFRLVLQPLLIAVAAGLSLVFARLWIGPGGAVAAVVFYLLVRGGVSVVVGPVLGELWAAVPLYLAEALLVEAVAWRLGRRPLVAGVVAGALIGTVGFVAEYAWTQVAFPLPWTPDIVVEGVVLATVGGVAGGLLAALLVVGLRGGLGRVPRPRLLFGLAVLALAAATVDGLLATTPDDLTVTPTTTTTVDTARGASAEAELRFDREPVDGEPAWVTVTSWQGGAGDGLLVDRLERVDETTWRTTEPVPVDGSWKTLLRVHDGRTLTAAPLFLPEDPAIDEPEVPLAEGEPRTFDEEKLILQRELDDDVPSWLWGVAGSVVLLCSLALVLGLGWGVARWSRLGAGRPGQPAPTPVDA